MPKSIFSSSIGQKIIMGATGAFLIVFVVMHLLGNLEIFFGRDAMNDYAVFLRSIPKALWSLRILTLVSFVTHIYLSIKLSLENKAARPVAYAVKHNRAATTASQTMIYSGTLLLAFILFHLAHLTFGWTHPEHFHMVDAAGRHDVYGMAVAGFQNGWIVCFYIIAVGSLCFHLSHGFSSAAQTFGIARGSTALLLRQGGRLFSALIFLGYVSIPLSVWLGFVG